MPQAAHFPLTLGQIFYIMDVLKARRYSEEAKLLGKYEIPYIVDGQIWTSTESGGMLLSSPIRLNFRERHLARKKN